MYESKGYPPLLYPNHNFVVQHHFLLTDKMGMLNSNRLARVSVKSLVVVD